MASFIVALINAWSAGRLDANKARRQFLLRQLEPSLEIIDSWYFEYWRVLDDDADHFEILAFLKRDETDRERRAWRTIKILTGDDKLWRGWRVQRAYDRLLKAKAFYIRTLQRKLAEEREGKEPLRDPRLAWLDAEVELHAGPTRGYIELVSAWSALRSRIIKYAFR
jgi:hypothetical protein